MKKIVLSLFLVIFIFASPVSADDSMSRGLFVTVLQEPQVLLNRAEIERLIDFAKKAHIKILFVQIYRANKAWFPSKNADQKPYDTCLKNVSTDPFALLIKKAHQNGIEVHAWLNLLSLSNNKDAVLLKKYGPEILTRNLKRKNKIEDYKIDNQYFLEPGDLRVRQALAALVEEILKIYPELDGIQFDYIRYPDKHPAYGYTKMNIERFKKATGQNKIKESSKYWQDWKRAQVTELLKLLAQKARQIHPGIKVSTTGCAPFIRAYHEAYQDWPLWINSGLVDFVTVMTYSGRVFDFDAQIVDAKKRIGDSGKINFTIGAYKLKDSPENFAQEFKLCEKSGSAACVILGYGDLLQSRQISDFLSNDLFVSTRGRADTIKRQSRPAAGDALLETFVKKQ